MPLILHLSDLHLVASEKSPVIGDHKVGLVPAGQRETFHAVLRHTLRNLKERLSGEGRKLDAIIMSGDVAHQNDPGGYDAFFELLGELDGVLPGPECILVVPGNHDVSTGYQPGDRERYEPFEDRMRRARFVTPWLEGIDTQAPETEDDLRRHLIRLGDVEIVPVNTSHFAHVRIETGISDAQWQDMERSLGGDAEAVKALKKLRVVDAARVSPEQMDAIKTMLRTATRLRGGDPVATRGREFPTPLRIGVLHHQLLPVSDAEEVKSFESFTNLGRLRQFLVENDIAIVLHGHKHEAVAYMDYVSSYDDPGLSPRQVLVIAGPSPSGRTFDRRDVCRLIEIDPDQPELRLEKIPAGYAGRTVPPGARTTLPYMRPGAATAMRTKGAIVVDGETVAMVYRQLLANVQAVAGKAADVVCRIGKAPSDDEISALYPGFPETRADEKLRRFRELVGWWQHPALVSAEDQPAFTHGTRILRYDGHLDQLAEVASVLRTDMGSSRGMVVLLSPSADRISDLDNEFPSFCLAQFLIRAENERFWLDCVAYFRKQEIRYWWLVNVAEIADLQNRLVKLLTAGGKKGARVRSVQAGSITTIAALAHAGSSPPKVQVPKVDQYYTGEREKLCAMVTALLWSGMPGREGYAAEWREVLTSLIPGDKRDPDGVAVAFEGLRFLLCELERHLEEPAHRKDQQLRELTVSLERLLHENTRYLHDDHRNRVDQERHDRWRAKVHPLISTMIGLTSGRISPAETGLAVAQEADGAGGSGT